MAAKGLELERLIKDKLYNNLSNYRKEHARNKWVGAEYHDKGVFDYGSVVYRFDKEKYQNDFWNFASEVLIENGLTHGFPKIYSSNGTSETKFVLELLTTERMLYILRNFIRDIEIRKNILNKLGKVHQSFAFNGDSNYYPMLVDGDNGYFFISSSGS